MAEDRRAKSATEPVKECFVSAAKLYTSAWSDNLSDLQQLELYGLYKQATQGPCTLARPGEDATDKILNKWIAWNSVAPLTREQAAKNFIVKVKELDPSWTPPQDLNRNGIIAQPLPSSKAPRPPAPPLTTTNDSGGSSAGTSSSSRPPTSAQGPRSASLPADKPNPLATPARRASGSRPVSTPMSQGTASTAATPASAAASTPASTPMTRERRHSDTGTRPRRDSRTGIIFGNNGERGMEGSLQKQRDHWKDWKTRYFRLEDQMLKYYLKKTDPVPRNELLVANCTVESLPEPVTQGGKIYFAFVISHPKNPATYNLAADSQEARDKWVSALKFAASANMPSMSSADISPGLEDVRNNFAPTGPVDVRLEDILERVTVLAGPPDQNGWEPFDEKNEIYGYRLKEGGQAAESSSSTPLTVRGDGLLPNHGVFKVARHLLDLEAKKRYDDRFDSGVRIKSIDDMTWTEKLSFKPVWPTPPRDMYNMVHCRIVGGVVEEPMLVIVAFSIPADSPASQREKNAVRATLHMGAHVLRRGPGGVGTKVSYILQSDMKQGDRVSNNLSKEQVFTIASLKADLESQSPAPSGAVEPTPFPSVADVKSVVSQALSVSLVNMEGLDGLAAATGSVPGAASTVTSNLVGSAGRPPSAKDVPAEAAGGVGDAGSASPTRTRRSSRSASRSQPPAPPKEPEGGQALTSGRLLVLLMPSVLYLLAGTKSQYRALAFLVGLAFAARYLIKLRLGSPPTKTSVVTEWGKPLGGSAVFRFPIELKRLLKYLEKKRDETGVEINVTHLTMKAVAIALQEMKDLNGHIAMGRFYRSPTGNSDVSYLFPHSSSGGGFAAVKIDAAETKTVEDVANELKAMQEDAQTSRDPFHVRRSYILGLCPQLLHTAAETCLGFLGSDLGIEVPELGVRAFPFGTATVITPPSEGSDMEVDVVGSVDNATQALAPMVITIGGIRVQSGHVGKEKQMAARPVLHMATSVDLRCGTVYQAKQFVERIQQLMREPQMIDKYPVS